MTIQSQEDRWQHLCSRYLPIAEEDSVWRLSRSARAADPEQGWKIHISATVLSASLILKRVAPYLCKRGLLFKAPSTLRELSKINCGLYYGFTQVGKFLTVYPGTTEEAIHIARKLHELTDRLPGPLIPFDLPLRTGSIVYYRYGSFKSLEIEQADGTRVHAMRNPAGELVPDERDNNKAFPAWVSNPFEDGRRNGGSRAAQHSPLKTTIRAYEVLSQRGKGDVYRALDLSVLPARFCILKEGRRHGETDWDGRDGRWRIRHEARVLSSLRGVGVNVPQVYTTFKVENHFYLVTEFIEGVNLQSLLGSKRRGLELTQALECGFQVAKLLYKIHAAGWVWRDCKPLNLIVTANNSLRPVDFEGACRVRSKERAPWGTPGYIPPEWDESSLRSKIPLDLYGLGATLHQLLTGLIPNVDTSTHALRTRRQIPLPVRNIIYALLDEDPQVRPDARIASKTLRQALSEKQR